MKHLLLSCLLLAALLGLSQCKKSDPAPAPAPSQLELLPPATQTGQRTFGCLVNGQAWTPAGSPLGGPLFSAQYYNQNLTIAASRTTTVNGQSIDQSLSMKLLQVTALGLFTLKDSIDNGVEVIDFKNNCRYHTNATHPATVVITKLDLVNRIVAGTFAFTLETPTCGKVVVTDGRFDSRF